MINQEMFEGYAYYFYEYNDLAEFGYFKVSRYTWSNLSFSCKIEFFFGYNSNMDTSEGKISSNQLHGQNIVKNKYQNWYLDINEIKNKHLIISTVFEATIKL